MWRDMERLSAQRGLRFTRPDPFPQNGLKAARLVLTIEAHPQRAAFVRAVYAAEFVDGLNISDDEVLVNCLSQASLPAETLLRCQEPADQGRPDRTDEHSAGQGDFRSPQFSGG